MELQFRRKMIRCSIYRNNLELFNVMPTMKRLLIVCVLCSLGVVKCSAQSISVQQDRYLKAFDAVWATVDQQFYDPSFLGVNWKAVGDKYRTRVPKIQDDAAFVDLIRQMLHELPTSHLGFRGPDASYDTSIGALLRTIDGKDVVSDVWFGTDAARKGLKPGDTILSTPKDLDGVWGSFANVRVLACDGQQKHLRIRREDYGAPFERPSVRWQLFEPSSTQKIGYMRIQHFEDDFAPVVDQAMSEMQDTSALIIDVRNNSGGNASYIRLVSYLTPKPHMVFALLSRPYLNQFGSAPEKMDAKRMLRLPKVTGAYTSDRIIAAFKDNNGGAAFYTEDVGSRKYQGKIIVLVNQETASAAEGFAAIMKQEPDVTLIGQPTAGAVVGAESFPIPGGWNLAVPTHSAWLGNGEMYRDEKTTPNILVPLTKADLCSQRDAVLDEALSLVE
jgi:carboxyl-terminal processing protease